MLAGQRWVQRHFYTVLMVMLAGGFTMLLAELLLTNHTEGIQLVAVAASVIGLALTGLALLVRGSARLVVAGLMLLLSVSGVIGTFEHLEEGGGELAATELRQAATTQATYQAISLRADEEDNEQNENEQNEGEENEGEENERGEEGEAVPPPLAPLSLAGLSVMAAVVMVGENKPSA